MRFTNSGSEAVGTAVRLARATTGRRLVIRFEGHYHGWQDSVYWSTTSTRRWPARPSTLDRLRSGPGVPLELADTLIVLTWNDPDSFIEVMNRAGS